LCPKRTESLDTRKLLTVAHYRGPVRRPCGWAERVFERSSSGIPVRRRACDVGFGLMGPLGVTKQMYRRQSASSRRARRNLVTGFVRDDQASPPDQLREVNRGGVGSIRVGAKNPAKASLRTRSVGRSPSPRPSATSCWANWNQSLLARLDGPLTGGILGREDE